MYKDKKICVVVPAFNEETQIGKVIETMPGFVDKTIIVNDCSTDNTDRVVEEHIKSYPNVLLLNHEKNQGAGAAISTGFKWARDHGYDVAVVIDGDGQMDPHDMSNVIDPVVNDEVDYTKGNRLFTGEAYGIIPRVRYLGNSALSMMTKIASGYWHVADSQSGFKAINAKALKVINWDETYKRYGIENDILVRLNINNMRVRDVPIKPLYNVGEKSGMKIHKIVFSMSWLLLRMFLKRLKDKYIIRDFHPLVFFYFFGFIFGVVSLLLFIRIFYFWLVLGLDIPRINAMAALFSFMSSTQFSLFAMWFDMEANKDLK